MVSGYFCCFLSKVLVTSDSDFGVNLCTFLYLLFIVCCTFSCYLLTAICLPNCLSAATYVIIIFWIILWHL